MSAQKFSLRILPGLFKHEGQKGLIVTVKKRLSKLFFSRLLKNDKKKLTDLFQLSKTMSCFFPV